MSVIFIKSHLLYTIFLYLPPASMSQSNETQVMEYSALTVLSLNWASPILC